MCSSRHTDREMGNIQKVIGIFTSPSNTFAALDSKPTWLLPILLIAIVNLGFIFGARDIILNVGLAEQEQAMLDRGMSREQIEQSLARAEWWSKNAAPVMAVITPVLLLLIVTAFFMFVGNVVLGGVAPYKKLLSVTAYSWLVFVLGSLITLPVVLAKESIEVTFSLAVFMPFASERTFLYLLLSRFDLFSIWWIGVYAGGLATIYEIKMSKATVTVAVVYVLYAVGVSSLTALS